MEVTEARQTARQGHIDGLARLLLHSFARGQAGRALFEDRFGVVAKAIEGIADLLLLLLGDFLQPREESGNEPFLAAEVAEAQFIQRPGRGSRSESGLEFGAGLLNLVEHSFLVNQ